MVLEGHCGLMILHTDDLIEKEFPVNTLRRAPSQVWQHVDTIGNVAVITRRGMRSFVILSVMTYAALSLEPQKTLDEIQKAVSEALKRTK